MSKVILEDFFDFNSKEPINRLAYTEEDMDYKIKVINKMKELGMDVSIDKIGNICGSITLGDKKGKTIAIGSHTDSVYNGGQFDGPVGVIVGLQVVENLQKKVGYNGTIKVVIYSCEESSKFGVACLGSKFLSGDITEKDFEKIVAQKAKDETQNVTLAQAIKSAKSYLLTKVKDIKEVDRIFDKVDYALEAHIEQYSVLHKQYKKNKEQDLIGIVTSIGSSVRVQYDVKGKAGHTGATPMKKRHNASDATSIVGVKVRKLGKRYEKNGEGRASQVEITTPEHNKSFNQIPDRAQGYIDFRLLGENTPDRVLEDLDKIVKNAEKKTKTKIKVKVVSKGTPVKTSTNLNYELEKACNKSKIRFIRMPSYPGQDTAYVPAKQKTMIFIPSTGGGHTPKEKTKKRFIESSSKIFTETCQALLLENFKDRNSVKHILKSTYYQNSDFYEQYEER